MFVRDLQELNARPPMDVTPSGMVTLVREEQPENAPSPMEVTLSGMVIFLRDSQERNASLPIAVTAYPSSVSGMDRIDAEPVYLTIAAVPSGWRV